MDGQRSPLPGGGNDAPPAAGAAPAVGFIGLGDQGLPMARAVAEAGFPLHVWARRPASLDGLRGVPHTAHDTLSDLAMAADIVALCVSTDEDVFDLVTGGLLAAMRPGAVLVNHGTGLPAAAVRLTELCAPAGVEVLDAPVSGGRPGAVERRLTTLVGGPESAARHCEPVFAAFSGHVVHLGAAGSGQLAKLLNNALLMLNQAAVADIVELTGPLGLDAARVADVLKLGSAASTALTLLNTMVTPDNVEHLSGVEALDMELFDAAMRQAGVDAAAITARGLAGANGLPKLVRRLSA
ncbi:NAD(P)-dependent oxidoreductase [Catenulispora pinisilvae]|uniref:NAD(P)-dependent oxidoreductase n=1 Tax=Catenulispora pinisilvae TaxID=2705253 RepID=UPI0018921CD1|nr:NAD(P)-binding domain-containing protein [Catenulispora pinisilvae]